MVNNISHRVTQTSIETLSWYTLMTHFIRRQDTFYFNKRLPHALINSRPLVRFSLQTSDRRMARYLSAVLAFKLEVYLEEHPSVDEKLILTMCRSWFSKELQSSKNLGITHTQPTSKKEPAPPSDIYSRAFKSGHKLSYCFTLYDSENVNAENWSMKSRADVKAAVDTLLEIVGDVPVHLLTDDLARNYKETLIKYPKQRTIISKLKTKPLATILKEPETYSPISPVTINNQLRKTRSFLNWCVSNKYISINPLSGLKVIERKGKEARLSFSSSDLTALFNDKLFTEADTSDAWKYWLPLIGGLTGCRMEEIAQLYLDDVYKHDDGYCFQITDVRVDQKLKNAASRRLVPLHDQLVDAGLPEYVMKLRQRGAVRLFPELKAVRGKYGHAPSKWFSKYRKLKNVSHEKKSFHSFRHTAIDELREEGVSDSIIKLIVGHADSSMTFGHYGSKLPIKQLKVAINKLTHIPKVPPYGS